jgi:hypothetical protein
MNHIEFSWLKRFVFFFFFPVLIYENCLEINIIIKKKIGIHPTLSQKVYLRAQKTHFHV